MFQSEVKYLILLLSVPRSQCSLPFFSVTVTLAVLLHNSDCFWITYPSQCVLTSIGLCNCILLNGNNALSFSQLFPAPANNPTPFDPPDHLFRIRLVCTLLDTCGHFFDRGNSKKRLDCFLIYFQVSFVCWVCNTLSHKPREATVWLYFALCLLDNCCPSKMRLFW